MNLFELVQTAPPDPILGLSEAFKNDPNPDKINLTVGVYQDESGKSPLLESVRRAEEILARGAGSKGYLPINGHPDYLGHCQALVFGEGNEMILTKRLASVHTPGGTGGLRLAGDFIRRSLGQRTIWVSNPTWANHQGIFTAAGLDIKTYPYYNPETHGLNLEGMITVLETIPENDIVLLHACCHNPTGVDPTEEDWETIAKVCKERKLLPLLDFAYQGFSKGWIDDAVAIRAFSEYGLEFIVCSSFSKNFGLYQDRVGAMHVVAKNADEAARILSQLKVIVRTNYSNPPAHGSAIVSTILNDTELRQLWEEELKTMRSRINTVRSEFVDGLEKAGVPGDFSFIREQKGMFSFSGLSEESVQKLRQDHAIYIVKSGRINVAGINDKNRDTLCRAIAQCI
ncbi:aspartate/tyrosine/aromatic aminotransferase [Puniceicoccales bacterium CK1056]|uniref:Aspartate/tyrosine/aromatic aminotransferase n=1 Tax=Oceanipulchritudo coccoides TaxID=2706888 RepID=A0A6B2M051_9BACT|nr:amino acid aminotransferase [Oceanipulchritudo coccoides]NDV61135.1 aspartate/tyrosine/aromatic aminotransferase [Oceanipulchritudo coccoides]